MTPEIEKAAEFEALARRVRNAAVFAIIGALALIAADPLGIVWAPL